MIKRAGGIIYNVVPYTRVGQERRTTRAKRYFKSKDVVRAAAVDALTRGGVQRSAPMVHAPYRVACLVTYPVSKLGKPIGGDWDNYLKALLDAWQPWVVPEDNASWFQGPIGFEDGTWSGVEVSEFADKLSVRWELWSF